MAGSPMAYDLALAYWHHGFLPIIVAGHDSEGDKACVVYGFRPDRATMRKMRKSGSYAILAYVMSLSKKARADARESDDFKPLGDR